MVPVTIGFVRNEEFDDFDDVKKRMDAYANKMGFEYQIKDSTAYNNKKKIPAGVEVPEILRYYMVKFACQRHGNYKSKGTGQRNVS